MQPDNRDGPHARGMPSRSRDGTCAIRIENDVGPFGSLLFANLKGFESCWETDLHIRDGTEIYIRPDSYRKSGLGIRKTVEAQPVHTPEWDKYARKFREKIKRKETKARRNREKICSVPSVVNLTYGPPGKEGFGLMPLGKTGPPGKLLKIASKGNALTCDVCIKG